MGRQRKSSSFFDLFRSCCSSGRDETSWDEQGTTYGRRIYASDEDRGYWVGEPGIDHRASAFIARFHETRRTGAEAVVY
ncbi:hypothetical protein RND81_05G136700 [Saponaria officinalis]|uniref:Uncharacterized protein n=1 Tax=Saponaria officinalis TaxID=3572 RepID=A0AAW1KY42_SAPOF